MGNWRPAPFVSTDGQEFTPVDSKGPDDPHWQIGNEEVSEKALIEFMEALRVLRKPPRATRRSRKAKTAAPAETK